MMLDVNSLLSTLKLSCDTALVAVFATGLAFVRLFGILSNFNALIDLKGSEEVLEKVILYTIAISLGAISTIILFRRNGENLHPDHTKKALDRVTNALIVHTSTGLLSRIAVQSGIIPSNKAYFAVLGLVWSVFWILACCSLAKAKGHHPIWGAVGIFNLSSTLLLSLLPDRPRHSADL
ncbi:MAG: hypothetical protein SFY66_09545 [Oculatellaceae cyanobacterium bins.114]|nr:hypothetical protein [Oculatellaceae cyanobacterium bins.114]